MPEILDIKNIDFSYNDKKILDGVKLSVKQGTITSILGRNGAGKSTLFLNLNGVLKPSSSEIYFKGERVNYDKNSITKLREKIGIVFQDPNDQLFSASVIKDVSFGAINLRLPKEEVKVRVEKALSDVSMQEYAETPTHALSFGQKKRVAIAGVLVMRPEIMILDEITAGLDSEGVSEILHLLTKIKDEHNTTIIIATHDIDIVPLYSDYVYVMDLGRIVMSGTPEEIFLQADKLRSYSLRLPRISHLMEILRDKDHLDVDEAVSTISKARRAIKELIKKAADE